ncbi:MAG: hypothetical protein ABIA75_05900, partial [Candidatus Neomarinimicrobiota bacterium]
LVVSLGIREIEAELGLNPDDDALSLMFDALTSLFYIDTFDRPDMRSVLEEAQRAVAAMGPRAIPLIVDRIDDADLKAELAYAQTCGLMGEMAITSLLDYYERQTEPALRAFILYAFGKIKSEKIVAALPAILEAVQSPTREIEDTAVRALGKIFESIRPTTVDTATRETIFTALIGKLDHPNDVIRSKAVRSLGKLARHGFLNDTQREFVRARMRVILGMEEDEPWDYAYLVRREARELLDNLD